VEFDLPRNPKYEESEKSSARTKSAWEKSESRDLKTISEPSRRNYFRMVGYRCNANDTSQLTRWYRKAAVDILPKTKYKEREFDIEPDPHLMAEELVVDEEVQRPARRTMPSLSARCCIKEISRSTVGCGL
jgi:hypothetical protein